MQDIQDIHYTRTLSGDALKLAVYLSEPLGCSYSGEEEFVLNFQPTSNWQDAAPIINMLKIGIAFQEGQPRESSIKAKTSMLDDKGNSIDLEATGADMLEAAMRLAVLIKCGETVEVPYNLLDHLRTNKSYDYWEIINKLRPLIKNTEFTLEQDASIVRFAHQVTGVSVRNLIRTLGIHTKIDQHL